MGKFVDVKLENGKYLMINTDHIVHLEYGDIQLSTGENYRLEDESWYELLGSLEFYKKEHSNA